jgi:hypothetical protein
LLFCPFEMADLATDITERSTVEHVKTPLESGAVFRRKPAVLEFATSIGKAAKPAPSGEFLDDDDVVDDVAPRAAKPSTKPLYPVIDRIVRRTRIEARETRSGTPWWLAGVVMGGLAIVGAIAGLSATGRMGASSPAVVSSVVGRTASVVAGRFTVAPIAVAAFAAEESAPIANASWTRPVVDPGRLTEHPLALTHLRPASHGAAHGLMRPHRAKRHHAKKSHPTAHA